MKKKQIPYESFDNFVLRTPLFSSEFYFHLTKNKMVTDDDFKKAFANPIVQEAVFLASPTLFFELKKWAQGDLDDMTNKKRDKLHFSLLKYLTRMSTRSTPFGLFGGCTLGKFTDKSAIRLSAKEAHKRHTRPDMNYLVALSQDLAKLDHIKAQLKYYPNSSIYEIGQKLRYIEYEYRNGRRHHHIVEIDSSTYLKKILSSASRGASMEQLASELVVMDIDAEDARSFINELLDSQVLISNLEPSVSGPSIIDQLLSVLEKLTDCENEISFLTKMKSEFDALDYHLGNTSKSYLAISEYIKDQPTSFELNYLFQADLELKTESCELAIEHKAEIEKALVLFNRISPARKETNLDKFKEAFHERYEDREMPLCNVLDVETGIGYLQDIKSGDVNPLIDDLVLPVQQDPHPETSIALHGFHYVLLQKLEKSAGKTIRLKETDFNHLPFFWHDLPDTLSTMVEMICENNITKIIISGFSGSSAANLLGRFCHESSPITTHTKAIVEKENIMNPDKILAEIVHLPEARIGNILMRPNFREYEIPYMAKSILPVNQQLPIQDLYISIRNNRIFLRSKKHDKEVIPHLTNAHNFSSNALPIYQFLCDMQTQGMRNYIGFSFGGLNQMYDFLPRVEYGNLIIHEARWRFKKKDIEPLLQAKFNTKNFSEAIRSFKDNKSLPTYVMLIEGDNELLINFENETSVLMFLETVKNREAFIVKEFLHLDKGVVFGSQNPYVNQVIISLFNQEKLIKNSNS